jgi:hypothetical protein
MQKNINNLTKTFIKIGFIATFAFAFAATVNVSVNKDFSLSAAVALADDAGGGGAVLGRGGVLGSVFVAENYLEEVFGTWGKVFSFTVPAREGVEDWGW